MDNKETTPDISVFLASAIHDMKNSLSVLINFLEGFHTELDDSTKGKMAPMLYEVKRVNNNLVQMLAIYKVGNEFYPFDLTENSIDEFTREIVMQNQTLLDNLGVTLELDYDEDLAWYFDRELVSGVITHALNNAVRYTLDKLRLSVRSDGSALVIRVEDNGTGYSDSLLEMGNTVSKGVDFASGSTGLGTIFFIHGCETPPEPREYRLHELGERWEIWRRLLCAAPSLRVTKMETHHVYIRFHVRKPGEFLIIDDFQGMRVDAARNAENISASRTYQHSREWQRGAWHYLEQSDKYDAVLCDYNLGRGEKRPANPGGSESIAA